jgi:hypothetical protein
MKNLRGQRFGRLVAKRPLNTRSTTGAVIWRCLCDCGNSTLASSSSLKSKHVKSCGCLSRETAAQTINKNRPPKSPMFKHGGTSDPKLIPTYRVWRAVLTRCYNTHATSYRFYGRVGVTVSERWRGPRRFQNFLRDLGTRPHGKSPGRFLDVGPYVSGNCCWQSRKEQQEEKRKKRQFIRYTLDQALRTGSYGKIGRKK